MKKNKSAQKPATLLDDAIVDKKHILLQQLHEYIVHEKGELLYFLSWKEKNSQRYATYTKELPYIHKLPHTEEAIQALEKKIEVVSRYQVDILVILQSLYHEPFDTIASCVLPDGYTPQLKYDVRYEYFIGKDTLGYTKEKEWVYDLYIQNKERFSFPLPAISKENKKKERLPLPPNHRHITNQNYQIMAQNLIAKIEYHLPKHMKNVGLDHNNQDQVKSFLSSRLLYCLIDALIEEKLIFHIKSTKSTLCLNGTIEYIINYIRITYGIELPLSPLAIQKKLRNNQHTLTLPMDVSYTYATLEEIDGWEEYLNSNYFFPYRRVSIDDVRREVMNEYNSAKLYREKIFELHNPLYHLYKEQEEQEKKHLMIVNEYKKRHPDPDIQIDSIVTSIKKNIVNLETQKKKYVVFEEDKKPIKGSSSSLLEIQQKYLRKYNVPIQYRGIFGIVIHKLNNFYKIKSDIFKQSNNINEEELQRLMASEGRDEDIMYYIRNIVTYDDMQKSYNQKRSTKREERKKTLYNILQDTSKYLLQEQRKQDKKCKIGDNDQLSIDFF